MDNSAIFKFKIEKDPFPWLRPISYMFLAAGLGLIFHSFLVAAPVLALGVFFKIGMKSTQVSLDVEKRTIQTKSGFGKRIDSFQTCDSIVISKKNMSQNISSRVSTTTIRYHIHQAHLSADGDYLLLAETHDRAELIKQVKPAAEKLKIGIVQ